MGARLPGVGITYSGILPRCVEEHLGEGGYKPFTARYCWTTMPRPDTVCEHSFYGEVCKTECGEVYMCECGSVLMWHVVLATTLSAALKLGTQLLEAYHWRLDMERQCLQMRLLGNSLSGSRICSSNMDPMARRILLCITESIKNQRKLQLLN